MKKTLLSIAFLLGGILMVAVLASARDARQNDPVTQARQQEDYYTCSMHPEVVSDEPGTCPICGMKLVLASSLGSGMMMHSTGDIIHMVQGNMMQEDYMTNDSLHMMQDPTMMGTMHESVEDMHDATMGDSTLMHQGHMVQ